MSVQAYQVYRQTQVSTASQGELLMMLFDGAIRFSRQSKDFMANGELEEASAKLIRTQDIINELILSLDLSVGEIAHNLEQLYVYIHDLLVQANIKKDPVIVDNALGILVELRDTWEQVVGQSR
ncbi:MAG TPA: flagellar export chaperone FliS [Limnochordia bacterium]|jgi:flagellar protein FliS|nr:flagellar export chaperone FliS [Limnochordia bacterium]